VISVALASGFRSLRRFNALFKDRYRMTPTDLGIQRALGLRNGQEILQRAERWRPWRAYAALHLWNSLEKAA
jgi:3-methyladenine DNA glycosylase/8-oxoguanine DNA glycosylase